MNLGLPRATYKVKLKSSVIWEAALGISVSTYPDIFHTLEKGPDFWPNVRSGLSCDLEMELKYTEENNTWYALLSLLHSKDFESQSEFSEFLNRLPAGEFLYRCLPFLGEEEEYIRKEAAFERADSAWIYMSKLVEGHKFFPSYISFLAKCDIPRLKQHLSSVLSGWLREVVEIEEESIAMMLKREENQKRVKIDQLDPEEYVESATGGIRYSPEPGIANVLLIPQSVYRPWHLEMTLQGQKVFYYPVDDANLPGNEDMFKPPSMLVQAYKALADEKRLRIIKHLYREGLSLQQLTDRLDMPKTTLHHHLSLLRSARIVKSEHSIFKLNKEKTEELSYMMESYLKRGMEE